LKNKFQNDNELIKEAKYKCKPLEMNPKGIQCPKQTKFEPNLREIWLDSWRLFSP